MRLIVARDTEAFGEMYRRHASAVAAIAARVTPDRMSADDITQGAFLALWTRAAKIDVRSGSLRAWLVTVARNAAIDRVRRLRPVGRLDETHALLADPARTEDFAMQNETQREIGRALATLAEDQRTVIELAYFGELSQSEIAAATGVPLGTVKGRVRLAMQHLRRALASPMGDSREPAR